jgi:hypothetical protein
LKKKTKNGPKWKQKNPNKPGKNGGFGATVRYAPVVTKVRYRKKNLVKKPKLTKINQQKKIGKKNSEFNTAVRYAPGVTKVRYRKKI